MDRKPKPRPGSRPRRQSGPPSEEFVDSLSDRPTTAFNMPAARGQSARPSRRNALSLLQPIRSFSPMEGLDRDAANSAGFSANMNRGIVWNSTVIEILIRLLCQEREAEPGRREMLFRALCNVIEQCNTSLYSPLHAYTQHQDFQTNLLERFEMLFERAQFETPLTSTSLAMPSLHLSRRLGHVAPPSSYHVTDRYAKEFAEVEVLGRGAFGVVVKAQHRLDGCFYAVKIIAMGGGEYVDSGSLLREVQVLARLSHPNVVRYHGTWAQFYALPPHLDPDGASLSELVSSVRITELSSSEGEESEEETSGGVSFRDEDASDVAARGEAPRSLRLRIAPGRAATGEGGGGDGGGVRSSSDESVVFRDDGDGGTRPSVPGGPLDVPRVRPGLPRTTLFIQMGLCGQSLSDWLLRRVESRRLVDRGRCLGLFRQLLSAVEYIHSHDIIHRDIKPANIFFTLEGSRIQLGDFGLARPLPGATATNGSRPCLMATSDTATSSRGVGTPIYAPPELSLGQYDKKSDMHNVGIILLELFQLFQTGCERIHVIGSLKKNRRLDQDFILSSPDIASWILKLTAPEPSQRPSASEVLKSSLFEEPRQPCQHPRDSAQRASPESRDWERMSSEMARLKEENLKLREMLARLEGRLEPKDLSGESKGQIG